MKVMVNFQVGKLNSILENQRLFEAWRLIE